MMQRVLSKSLVHFGANAPDLLRRPWQDFFENRLQFGQLHTITQLSPKRSGRLAIHGIEPSWEHLKSTGGIQWQLTTCLKLISIIIIPNLTSDSAFVCVCISSTQGRPWIILISKGAAFCRVCHFHVKTMRYY